MVALRALLPMMHLSPLEDSSFTPFSFSLMNDQVPEGSVPHLVITSSKFI